MSRNTNKNFLYHASCCVLAFLWLCLLAGCGGDAGKGMPRLITSAPLGPKGFIRFPKTPEKFNSDDKQSLPDGKSYHTFAKGGKLTHENFYYEAGCFWVETKNIDDEIIEKIFEMSVGFFSREFRGCETVSEELSNGMKVHFYIGTDNQNHPKSGRIVITPDRRIYGSTLVYQTSEIPTLEQIKHEKAFHNSLRIGGRPVKDSLGDELNKLYAERVETMTKYEEGRAAREEAAKRHAAQMELDRGRADTAFQNARNMRTAMLSGIRDSDTTESSSEQDTDSTEPSSQQPSGPQLPSGMRLPVRPIGPRGFSGRMMPFGGESNQPEESDSQQPDNGNPNEHIATGSPPSNEQRPPVQPNPVQANPAQPRPPMPGPVNFGNSLGMSRMGTAFSEATPDNFVLVGFAVTFKKWGTNDCIESIQPLYRSTSGTGTKRGTVYGNAIGESKLVGAPADYAVGAINGRAVAVVDGFELVCMKIKPDGSLDPNDTKISLWVGNTQPGAQRTIDGKGKPVSEIKGYTADYLSSLEFVF
ncbi:MAG: hypothetical protein FWD31_14210 [Planctomycetaceae bacterium]|nr:hypothetical protein [Planctomycetaceae bacterium]